MCQKVNLYIDIILMCTFHAVVLGATLVASSLVMAMSITQFALPLFCLLPSSYSRIVHPHI